MTDPASSTEYLLMALVLGPIGVYLAARLITVAFFKSKQQYERQKQNDTRKN